ncbi:MAG: PAS domain S-box protein [Betaproteobacteria bacterium]|nr:PAS domain S-box protein [Betaproteobacteria bacterium]
MNSLVPILAAAAMALGMAVMLAWKMQQGDWLLAEGKMPMQFNSALLVFLAGGATLLGRRGWRLAAATIGLGLAAFAGLVLIEHWTGINLYIGGLFHQASGASAQGGRMAFSAALAFFFIGGGLLLANTRWAAGRHGKTGVIALGTLVIFIGLNGLIGDLTGTEALQAWTGYTNMSALTAIACIVLGLDLVLLALAESSFDPLLVLRLASVLAALAIAASTLLTWDIMRRDEERNHQAHIDRVTQAIAQAIDTDLYRKKQILEAIAQRWERAGGIARPLWRADALIQASDHGFQAIEMADKQGVLRWVVPLEGNEAALGLDLGRDTTRRQALEAARANRGDDSVFTAPLHLVQGGSAILGFRALFIGDKLDGYLVAPIQLDRLLEQASIALLPQHTRAALYADGKPLASTGYLDGPAVASSHGHDTWQALRNAPEIKIHVEHDAAYLDGQVSRLPSSVLATGLITAGLLGATLWLWQLALARARESEAAAALSREHEARLTAVVDTSIEGIFTTDAEGRIDSLNWAVEQIFGHDHGEAVGRDFTTLLAPPYRAEYRALLEPGPRTGHAGILGRRREIEGLRNDGEAFPMELAVEKLQLRGKRIFTGMLRDIGERKRAEADILDAKVAAEQASRAKSLFLASMSHELRTPMNAIMGYAQLLELDPKLGNEQRDCVQEINRASAHLLELINEVLDLSQIEAGKIEIKPEHLDPGVLLEDCLRLSWPLATRQGIRLELTPPAAGLHIHADRTRTKQIMLNLISNAIKYNREGGQVSLAASPSPGGAVRLIVSDTGHGIPANMASVIFQPFNRAGREGSNIEGTGIGLTICQRLANAMHSHVGFESRIGEGSTFWLELPTSENHTDTAARVA